VDRLLESVGAPLNPLFRDLRSRYFDDVRKACGERVFQGALSEGGAMSLTRVVQYALAKVPGERVPDDAFSDGLAE
jgi:hypothetical protein